MTFVVPLKPLHGSLIVSAFPPCYVHGIISWIETERIALLSIKAGINHSNDQSLFSSWTGNDCCKWQGVSCNHQSRHVIKLDLRQHLSNVSDNYDMPPSKLNTSLIQLHHLKHLDLSMNNFDDSPIPDFIGSFANLEYLNLSNAGFSGAIPHIFGNLSCLHYLDLNSNDNLQPNDLHWLSGMTSLHYLDLSGVDLSNVHGWFHDVNMLPSLLVLKLSDAGLQADGIHDTTLLHHLNFTSLRVLDLSHNYGLNITLPQWLFNLTSLVRLDLYGCSLYGKLPVTVGNLSRLKFFSLFQNSFDGVIPESLGNLGSLETLDLSANELNGRIPESFGKLTSLTVLDLSMNNISGTLPKSMGKLCKLRELDLSRNLINGAIDDLVNSLSNCPENKKSLRNSFVSEDTDGMSYLNVGNNRFNGTVPESIGRLANLRILRLQENSFDGTLTKHHFANLTDLYEMDFSYNLLQLNVPNDWVPPFHAGAIKMCSCRINSMFPAWLKTQTGLWSLCLSESGISGNVPTWFSNLSSNHLVFLNISHNNLSGILPTLQHSFLEVIDMSHNKFEGLIPDWKSSGLNIIDLRNNSLFGPISSSFASANPIQVLSLSHNHINGSIPFFLCNLTNLVALDLSSNNMSGELPHCWNQLSLLTIIDLSNNNFFGSIPEAIVSDTNLQSLHLQNNSLSGNLPLSLKNAKILVVLDIGENRLSGTIPSWIGSLVSLVVLRLRSNLFEGAIPEQLLNLSSLQVLDLAQNNLSGVIFPHTFGGFKAMATSHSERSQLFISQYDQVSIFTNGSGTYKHLESLVISAKGQEREYTTVLLFVTSIDLSCNRLSGKFPDELTSLHGLIFLNLSNNLFNGKLPENIGDMNQLQSLDLSSNNFSGIIPPSISALYFLSKLNLSHNKLSGKIPSGNQLQTLDASAFFYNDGLCGYPLSNCTNMTPAQGSFHGGNQDGNGDWFDDLWLYIGLASGFIVGFWMFIVFIMIKESRRMSYFRSIERVYDWIYVKLVIYSRRLKLILARRN